MTSTCPSRSLRVLSAAGVRRAADGSLRVRELKFAEALVAGFGALFFAVSWCHAKARREPQEVGG